VFLVRFQKFIATSTATHAPPGEERSIFDADHVALNRELTKIHDTALSALRLNHAAKN
jgi:hypothetical protein